MGTITRKGRIKRLALELMRTGFFDGCTDGVHIDWKGDLHWRPTGKQYDHVLPVGHIATLRSDQTKWPLIIASNRPCSTLSVMAWMLANELTC